MNRGVLNQDSGDGPSASVAALSDSALYDILSKARTIAVLGLKLGPAEVSYRIADYLHRQGYRIVPVSPKLDAAFGVDAVATLAAIDEPVDIIDVFRASANVPQHAQEALAMRHPPGLFWMQSGVEHADACRLLRAGGVAVVENRCLMVEHARLFR